jgi:folate-binding protein YgfZ
LADVDDYETARVAAGWPAMGTEIVPGERIPAEIAVAPATVNFTKGCYPGQELVERMDSRGSQAPRQLRIVSVDDAANPDVEITSVAGDKALAYVKRGAGVGAVPGPTSR